MVLGWPGVNCNQDGPLALPLHFFRKSGFHKRTDCQSSCMFRINACRLFSLSSIWTNRGSTCLLLLSSDFPLPSNCSFVLIVAVLLIFLCSLCSSVFLFALSQTALLCSVAVLLIFLLSCCCSPDFSLLSNSPLLFTMQKCSGTTCGNGASKPAVSTRQRRMWRNTGIGFRQ